MKDDKPTVVAQDKPLHEEPGAGMKDLVVSETVAEKDNAVKYKSDMFDSAECAVNMLRPDIEDRDASPINWDTGTAEIHPTPEPRGSEISSITMQNGAADRRSSSIMDDSSSTCSTDSAPSVIINGSYRSNSSPNYKSQKSSPSR